MNNILCTHGLLYRHIQMCTTQYKDHITCDANRACSWMQPVTAYIGAV